MKVNNYTEKYENILTVIISFRYMADHATQLWRKRKNGLGYQSQPSPPPERFHIQQNDLRAFSVRVCLSLVDEREIFSSNQGYATCREEKPPLPKSSRPPRRSSYKGLVIFFNDVVKSQRTKGNSGGGGGGERW